MQICILPVCPESSIDYCVDFRNCSAIDIEEPEASKLCINLYLFSCKEGVPVYRQDVQGKSRQCFGKVPPPACLCKEEHWGTCLTSQ